jgi:DNA-binding response OmpR family regulator
VPKSDEVVSVLVASPSLEDQTAIRRIFGTGGWKIYSAGTAEETFRALHRFSVDIVITATEFPEGPTWRDVVEEIGEMADPRPVIIASRLADDRLWAEVLNLGAYDLLQKPFDENETRRVVGLAAWHSRRRRAPVADCPLAVA